MEKRRFQFRTGVVAALTVAVMLVFLGLLWHYQLSVGMDAAALAAMNTMTRTETVPAARGRITDRSGTVLVDNRIQYRIVLNPAKMGDGAAQGQTVVRLLELCKDWGEAWADSELPVTKITPYQFTDTQVYARTDSTSGGEALTRLGKLCQAMGWEQTSDAGALMAQMKETFALTNVQEQTARNALGVLYSCCLRQKELLWTDYCFAEDVGIGLITAIREESLPGVEISAAVTRRPQTPYAAHLLGRVGLITAENWTQGENYQAQGYDMDDSVGLSGVEYAFERYLRGSNGVRTVTTDRSGEVISVEESVTALAGADVALTLDGTLQAAAEEALAQYVPQLNGGEGGGTAVVVSVQDGGVLACANYPTYDLQTMTYEASAADLSPLFNRGLQGTYSPGSTFKMVTAVAGLETGVIQPDSPIPCTGYMDYYGTVFRCWLYRERGATHSRQETVTQALRDSCNIFFYNLGIAVGIETLTDYARAFGLGVPTGIELAEATGVNAGPAYSERVGGTWYGGNLLSAAIGQSDNLFTPLQIANYIATLVNGGTRYAAHLLQRVTYADGTVEEYQARVLGNVTLSAEHLAAVKQGMRAVVTDSAAVSQAFSTLEEAGIPAGAKTGSAQVSGQGNANGLFVCFAPYDDPEVAVCVAVEKGGSGAATAVIAAEILEAYFGVPGTINEETAPASVGEE